MATSKKLPSSPVKPAQDDEAQKASKLFTRLADDTISETETKSPKDSLDEHVAEIFKQASRHRERLITFFILYTIFFSLFVIILIFMQAYTRVVVPSLETVELIPNWALSLLVTGMFGQFIGLLTIVTKKVWTFEAFFKHAEGHGHER